jgi:hypothetical protein
MRANGRRGKQQIGIGERSEFEWHKSSVHF